MFVNAKDVCISMRFGLVGKILNCQSKAQD